MNRFVNCFCAALCMLLGLAVSANAMAESDSACSTASLMNPAIEGGIGGTGAPTEHKGLGGTGSPVASGGFGGTGAVPSETLELEFE